MLAFTRKPPPDDDVPDRVELLLDDADDALVPLAPVPSSQASPEVQAPIDDVPMRLVAAPRWTSTTRQAYQELAVFVERGEPLFGWRHALFVVTGIRLRASRAERVLREHVAVLLEGVDPLILDPEKEASS